MVRSKGNGKKAAASPYREYMELRSMSRRPPPPYTQVDSQRLASMLDDPTSKRQNVQDSNRIRLGDEDTAAIIIKSGCVKYPTWRCAIYCIYGLLMVLLCTVLISLLFPYPLHASCVVKCENPPVIFCKVSPDSGQSFGVLMGCHDCFLWPCKSLRKMCSKITPSRFCKQSWAQGNSILPGVRKFDEPCTPTMQQFRSQILRWSPCANCGPRGSRCLYRLKEPKQDESRVIRAVHLAPSVRTEEAIKIAFEDVNGTCVGTGESVSKEWLRIFDYGANYCNLHNLVTGIGFDKSQTFFELTVNAICTQYNMAVCD